jgi:hypothetical protein
MGLDGIWADLARIAIIIAVAYGLVLWVAAIIWAYRDISARTRDTFSQVISLVLVLVFNLPGLLVYLILRPKQTMAESYDRQLEAEALLHEIQEQATCPSCRRRIDDDFITCPFCRTSLRSPCDSCGKALATTWVLCPYCSAARAPVALVSSRQRSGDPADDQTVIAQRPKRPASTATYTPPATAAAVPPADTAIDA